jgi:hypothetical protein
VERGFFNASFVVTLTNGSSGSTIHYTTDGTDPLPGSSQRYAAPIEIATTTVLRAAAYQTGFGPSDIVTHSYLFLADVVNQPNDPAGYPSVWAGRRADYEMDPDVVTNPDYKDDFDDALKSFPTLSLALNPDDLFGVDGLYQNPQSAGAEWERAVSAEFIVSDDSEPGFHINAGLRIQGGSSRNPDTPKHSLSLRFRRQYGAGKLDYPVYRDAPAGETAVEQFDYLQLRSGYNFGWYHRHYYQARHAQYNRDQWVNDLYLAMGQTGTHGRWVHVYFNGIYWGLYHFQERPDADFMSSYFGGADEDYDVLNSGSVTDGNNLAWSTMNSVVNSLSSDPGNYELAKEHVNVDALIDYMLVNFYVGNRDWDGHNWRAGVNRETGMGFIFFPWDSEFAISPNNAGRIANPAPISAALSTDVTGRNGNNRPSGVHQRLTISPEYRLRFADRAQKHFFNGGVRCGYLARALGPDGSGHHRRIGSLG